MAQENNKTPKTAQAPFSEGTAAKGKTPRRSAARHAGERRMINAFDLIVVVLLAAAIALLLSGTQLQTLFRTESGSTPCTVEYMVMFSDVDEDFAYAVANGNTAYHTSSKAAMGTVYAEPEVQAHRVVIYADGEAQMQDKPGSVDVIITIRAAAEYTEGVGYTVGTTTLRVGSSVSLRFPNYSGVGSCINISKLADGSAVAAS